jgi:hypothetical protein
MKTSGRLSFLDRYLTAGSLALLIQRVIGMKPSEVAPFLNLSMWAEFNSHRSRIDRDDGSAVHEGPVRRVAEASNNFEARDRGGWSSESKRVRPSRR